MATDLLTILRKAGFQGDALRTAYGIAMRESGGRPQAFNGNTGTGDRSYGLFQINMLGNLGPARLKQFGLSNEQQLLDPLTNARAAFRLSGGGKDFGAWGIGPNAYRTGVGYDTIRKYVESLPRNIGQTVKPVELPNTLPGKRAPLDFAQLIREGKWSIDAPLEKTIRLSRSFRQVSGKQIPGTPLRFPSVRGSAPASAAPIVAEAFRWLGTPYSWAGGGIGGPSKGQGRGANTVGFDCSGFLQYLWGKKGVQIPRVTYDQWRTGQEVGTDELQPGDAVFFHMGSQGPTHTGMYIGDGKFIHAPHTGDVIKVSSLSSYRGYVGARRYG